MGKEVALPPSAIILAGKRSGTNFVHNMLSPSYRSSVMEPLGLHNESLSPLKRNPLDPWNYASPEDVSEEFGHKGLKDDHYGAFLAKNFLFWLREGGKLIKETDPLPVGWLLASVPLRIVSIFRDPRDSIASFKRDNLYTQWVYGEKMKHFMQTVESNHDLSNIYGGFTSSEAITTLPKHRQLAIYYAVVLQEIERTTASHNPLQISYEDLVDDSIRTFNELCTYLSLPLSPKMEQFLEERTTQNRGGGIHGTFRRNNHLHTFQNILTSEEEADIRSICGELGVQLEVTTTQDQFPSARWEEFETYEQKYDNLKQRTRESVAAESRENSVPLSGSTDAELRITKYLVTNEQYAQFLYWLKSYDIPITYNGKPIFYNDRPQSRLHYDDHGIIVDQGYEKHPVTYMNWLGATAYAAWIGGRLPLESEWIQAAYPQGKPRQEDLNADLANFGEHYGSTTPVGMFPPNEIGIYDAIGNASIWLADSHEESIFEQTIQGLGWNHTEDWLDLPYRRPYWFGSSGLGIRVIFEEKQDILESEMAERIGNVVLSLTKEPHDDIIVDNQKLKAMIQTLNQKD